MKNAARTVVPFRTLGIIIGLSGAFFACSTPVIPMPDQDAAPKPATALETYRKNCKAYAEEFSKLPRPYEGDGKIYYPDRRAAQEALAILKRRPAFPKPEETELKNLKGEFLSEPAAGAKNSERYLPETEKLLSGPFTPTPTDEQRAAADRDPVFKKRWHRVSRAADLLGGCGLMAETGAWKALLVVRPQYEWNAKERAELRKTFRDYLCNRSADTLDAASVSARISLIRRAVETQFLQLLPREKKGLLAIEKAGRILREKTQYPTAPSSTLAYIDELYNSYRNNLRESDELENRVARIAESARH